jgi:Thiol-disulfide isomerase and thioredoxins
MKKYCIYTVLLMLAMAGQGYAQRQTEKPVSTGEQVPPVEIKGFLSDSSAYQVADLYNGKDLLLIDFWATWCSPCIKAFSKLAAIKRQFGERVEVVAATYESREKIERFFARNQDKFVPDVRFLVEDTLLSALFPHRVIPHVVWVNGKGELLATTDADEVTPENINAVINGSTDQLITKADAFDFDITDNLPVGDDNFLFRSVLTKYRPGVNGVGRTEPFTGIAALENDDERLVKRAVHLNTPISFLYMYAAYGGRFLKNNKHMIVLEISDSLHVVHPVSYKVSNSDAYRSLTHWRTENAYCYELNVAEPIPAPLFYQYMMEDLNRYFSVYGTVEKRWRDCYVIVNKDDYSKTLRSKGGQMDIIVDPKTKFSRVRVFERIQNMTMNRFVRFLNYENLGIPILNETVNTEPLDLEIGVPLTREALDMEKLRRKLLSQGFDIIKTKRLIDVLVIRDK